jgi:hypothetical protein
MWSRTEPMKSFNSQQTQRFFYLKQSIYINYKFSANSDCVAEYVVLAVTASF